MDEAKNGNRSLTRRRALLELGGFAAGALGVGTLGAKELLEAEEAAAAGSGPAAVASGLVTCVLAPEMTEGPYYVEGDKVRRNITEGKSGVPLTLRLTVVDVSSCKPIKGAAVDIWHCDAGGTYSGTSQQSTDGLTFLRGIQRTDKQGLAIFKTIYPGWYPGRAVHIHLKAYLGGTTVHTGQLFFPDKLTDVVYKRAPYNRRPNRDPRNAADSIYRNGGARSTLKLVRSGNAYIGRITMGVARS
ncbi:MAG: intradiol ring-cleavage dioxygenase [Actinobacteria bacterium]|nr:intradiol ring-cleavage dioxygenase [Actinomycetota bacterium]